MGVPKTEHILNISSTSLVPGNSGLEVYISAIIQPTAHRSIGELYAVERSNTSGARYLGESRVCMIAVHALTIQGNGYDMRGC